MNGGVHDPSGMNNVSEKNNPRKTLKRSNNNLTNRTLTYFEQTPSYKKKC